MLRRHLVIAPLLLLAIATACASGQAKRLTLGSTAFNSHGTKVAKAGAVVELEADSYYFSPTFLRGEPGQTVKLELANDSSSVRHNFTLLAQKVDLDLAPRQKAEVSVTFAQSGVLQFFCEYHTGQGMNGELLAGDAKPQAVAGAPTPATAPTAPSPGSGGY
jgi:plastocyanin